MRIINMYKTKNIIYKDDRDKKTTDIFSDYGYNFDSIKRTNIDLEAHAIKPRLMTNKDYINKR